MSNTKMITKLFLILLLLSNLYVTFNSYIEVDDQNGHKNDPYFHKSSPKFHLKRLPFRQENDPRTHVLDSTIKDLNRFQALHRKVIEKKNTKNMSKNVFVSSLESSKVEFSGNIIATLKSGASYGSGEYFIDMFIGTPPKHFWLILDTASDLNWIQCLPCYDCFDQNGPYYDPKDSSSFKNITCHDPRCRMVSSGNPLSICEFRNENQTCPYFYDYADGSNTTGDFSLENFTMNLTWPNGNEQINVDIMFGCGHLNKGNFRGASGLLGLGRGPLSFSSQLQSIYGHSFSYCLADIFSDPTSTSSKLMFGENKELLGQTNLNFTSFLGAQESPNETFYYVKIKFIMVGGEVLDIPEKTWNNFSLECVGVGGGGGGTIIDSGSTLSYFPSIAYDVIREAFKEKIELNAIFVEVDFVMDICYNISGGKEVELPEFVIHFVDGAVWNFAIENVFYPYEANEIVCLAILETPYESCVTIIGNLMQQNFHIVYDMKNNRLGYSPRKCAEI